MRTSEIFVTVDIVVLRTASSEPEILLVRRKNDPFRAMWALPGGFVDKDEDLADAAKRELLEETGIKADNFLQLQAFGKPGRDPRGHTISVAFLAFAAENMKPRASDDASDAKWFTFDRLPAMAFDHSEIIEFAKSRI